MAAVVTNKVRFSFCNIFTPRAAQAGQPEKYSLTVLVPKSDTDTYNRIQTAVRQALADGVSRVFGGQPPANPSVPLHDGDGTRPSGEPFGEECRGCWVFTASSVNAPAVVDAGMNPVLDPTAVYSGCYGRVDTNVFAYNKAGRKGVGFGLNSVQMLADGEPLGGTRRSAEEAFGAPVAPSTPAYAQPQATPPAPQYQTAPNYGAPQY